MNRLDRIITQKRNHFELVNKKLCDVLKSWHQMKYVSSDRLACYVYALNIYSSSVPQVIKQNDILYKLYYQTVLPTLSEEDYIQGSSWLTNYDKINYKDEEELSLDMFSMFSNPSYVEPVSIIFDEQQSSRLNPIHCYGHDRTYTWTSFWDTKKISNHIAEKRTLSDTICDADIIILASTLTSKLLYDILEKCKILAGNRCFQNRCQRPLIRPLNFDIRKWEMETHDYHVYTQYGYYPNVAIFCIDAILNKSDTTNYFSSIETNRIYSVLQIQAERKEKAIKKEIESLKEAQRVKLESLKEAQRIKELREYNIVHAHHLDQNIKPTNNGKFTFNGLTFEFPSNLLKPYFPTYRLNDIAISEAERNGVSIDSIKQEWAAKAEETKKREKALHDSIERFFSGYHVYKDKSFNLFEEFQQNTQLWPYRTNWIIYDNDAKVAAIVDLLEETSKGFIVYKLKSSDNYIENGLAKKYNEYFGSAEIPFNHLGNTPYFKCAMELNIIKYILEKNYDITVSELRLGVFYPSFVKPYVLRMPELKNEVLQFFENRSDIVY